MYDRTIFSNGFASGRQRAIDTINDRINYLQLSQVNHTPKVRKEISRTITELKLIAFQIERLTA